MLRRIWASALRRHHLRTIRGATPLLVVVGYNRPLNECFLRLYAGSGAKADEPTYSSLDEPAADWRDAATAVRRLDDFDLAVPRSKIVAVVADAFDRAGNRIVEHALNGGVRELSV